MRRFVLKAATMVLMRAYPLRNWLIGSLMAATALTAPALASSRGDVPAPAALISAMASKNMDQSAPILVRVFKMESVLEVWKQTRTGRYELLKSYPICRWSGQLGPKRKQGDRQAPEGFYSVGARQMNPNSAYYLSFDTGFPNAYDRAQGASGSALMVHGSCSSAGCYAMTDQQISEIFALARDALAAGQRAFQFQAYPFRMTPKNLARHRGDSNIAFWRQLKEGYDFFEATRLEPRVSMSGNRYAFNLDSPAEERIARQRHAEEESRIAELITAGTEAVRTVYQDGGQNAIFTAMHGHSGLGDISRPDALAYAGREIVVTPGKSWITGLFAGKDQPGQPLAAKLVKAAPVAAEPRREPVQMAAMTSVPLPPLRSTVDAVLEIAPAPLPPSRKSDAPFEGELRLPPALAPMSGSLPILPTSFAPRKLVLAHKVDL
jgi:murein L,D-transpeptidase YafK